MTTTRTVRISGFPAYRLAAARAAVEQSYGRLAKAAARAGEPLPPMPEIVVVREAIVSRCSECRAEAHGFAGGRCQNPACDGFMSSIAALDLDVTFPRPVIGTWEFLATVEPLDGGNLIKQVPGAMTSDGELARYRAGAMTCDHCQKTRHRLETFVLRSTVDGSSMSAMYKQVGRQCLRAFLGGKSALDVLWAVGFPALLAEIGEGEGAGGDRGPRIFDPLEFLSWVASSIRIGGWFARSAPAVIAAQVMATADHAMMLCTPPRADGREAWKETRGRFAPTEADCIRAAGALGWARALPGASDYERNLQLVASQPMLDAKHAGILASACAGYARHLGDELARAGRATSAHRGTIGAKLDAGRVTIERVATFESDYGTLFVHTFRDADGNALVWKTGKSHGVVGDVVELTGTVKKHDAYKGEAQTQLARCAIKKL